MAKHTMRIFTRYDSFLESLEQLDKSIEDTVLKEEFKYYKILVSDLIGKWKENQLILKENISLSQHNLRERIEKKHLKSKTVELEELIADCIDSLINIREEMEEKVFPQIPIDLKIAQKKLLTYPTRFQGRIKDSLNELNLFVKDVSLKHRAFKASSEILINK